ncbi:MAG: tetratricopeptide repeat protein [Salinibacter sp.]
MLRLSQLAAMLAVPFALLACGSSSPLAPAASASAPNIATADSLLQRAKTLIDEGADHGALDSLKHARSLAVQATGESDRRALAHYYAALAGYRTANQLPEDAEERREAHTEDAIRHLKRATDVDSKMADAWALLAGSYGQMMGMNPMQGMTLSSDADDAIERAKDLAPRNPRVWIIDGTSDFFTPSMFGGDKERALEKFEKAARLAEQESTDDPLAPSWGHAEAYAWTGLVHMDADRYEDARSAFQTALNLDPDFGWVQEVLLPRLDEQTG